jgi:hypothetical protein
VVRLPQGYNRRAGGWPVGVRVPAGTQLYRRVQPRSIPQTAFRTPVQVEIGPYGFAQGVVAAGTAQLVVGPTGYGTAWDLAQASVNSTVGPTDPATVEFFAQPYGPPSQPWQIGVSYQGGGDQVPLAGIRLVPGLFLFAVWSGATNGSTVTLVVSGTMSALT